ncbi:hypothetical protein FKG94_27935 [Exilibacterium tricleocarpae]|uniref:Uncharacterized protein n=1 Tax=Exilibacterium tricleocarpae TaxID=2591008 RepID=A0A545SLI4_9GAMM|nr:hypothetical protein [Exilibacterium tricleocarpae]TQV65839.1 hypothetical protein FKG94_27935 [Exilibacterium tricleocarpae]
MIRIIFTTIILFFSNSTIAWECPESGNSFDVDLHWHLATDVVAGKVLGGELLKNQTHDQHIKFKFEIARAFKGKLNGVIELTFDDSGEITLGSGYILFLYRSKKMDFCSKYIKLLTPDFDNEPLRRKDVGYADDIQFILNQSKDRH